VRMAPQCACTSVAEIAGRGGRRPASD